MRIKKTTPLQKPAWIFSVFQVVGITVIVPVVVWVGFSLWGRFFSAKPPIHPPKDKTTSISSPLPEPSDDPSDGNSPSLTGADRGGENRLEDPSEISMKMMEWESKEALIMEKNTRILHCSAQIRIFEKKFTGMRQLGATPEDIESDSDYAEFAREHRFRETQLSYIDMLREEMAILEETYPPIKEHRNQKQAAASAERNRRRREQRQLRASSSRNPRAISRTRSSGPSDSETLRIGAD